MRFDLATSGDDAEIRRVLRENPLAGEVRLSLEREPDSFIAGAVQGDRYQMVVARDEPAGPVVGMGSRAILEAWIDGAPGPIGYLSQLRVDRPYRGRGKAILKAYAFMRQLHADGAVPFYVTTIVEDNLAARRLLEANLPSMPRYHAVGRLVTLALRVRRAASRRAAGVSVAQAGADSLDEVVSCLGRHGRRHQFAPRWSRELLRCPRRCHGLRPEDFFVARRGDRVVGCAACWDQRGFKQTVVRGYGPRLRWARHAVNAVGPWFGLPRLPRPGDAVRSVFLSHVAVDDDDPEVLVGLVDAAMASRHAADADYLVMGLAESSPLLGVVKGTYACRAYPSLIYIVHWEDGAAAAAALGRRVPHLEVAIL